MKWFCAVVLISSLGTIWCQNELPDDLQDLSKTIGDNLGEIPGMENFNQSAVPSMDELKDTLKKKCEKNGGAEAFTKVEEATGELQTCIQSNFNFTQIQEELDASRKTGSMDEVFAKYCLKSPVVQDCVKNLTLAFNPCLEEEEKANMKLLLNVTESLANFICYKDGDRIAMFVAEGGFECIQSKREGLEQCANDTLRHRIPTDLSLDNLPLLAITDEACDDYAKLQKCAVGVLEKCNDNTPANIIDALFKFIRRVTPCKNHAVPSSVLGGAQPRYARDISQEHLYSNNVLKAYEAVKSKYEPHCLRNGGEKALTEFKNTIDQVHYCLTTKLKKFEDEYSKVKGFPYDYLCKDLRSDLRGCLSTLLEKINACLSRSEHYVSQLGLDLYDSVSKFYCKDDAKVLKKFLQDEKQCINKIQLATGNCINETKHVRVFDTDAVVTKDELCSDLKIIRNCFINTTTKLCPQDKMASEFAEGLSDALYAPCTGCRILSMKIGLLAILLIVTKIF